MNSLFVIGAVVLVILLMWMFIAKRHLKGLILRVEEERLVLKRNLKNRYDLLPNLVETVRTYTHEQEGVLGELIKVRTDLMHNKELDLKRVELEYELTKLIDKIIDLGRIYKDLSLDTNFLELRKELSDLEQSLDNMTKNCNAIVRDYNKVREGALLVFWAKLFGFKEENIFEFEK